MTKSEDTQPVFPPEIEEIIFSLYAQRNLKKSGNLILVAKRVYHWLRPWLYEVVIFHEDTTHDRLKFNSALLEIHGQHVRHILFWEITALKHYSDNPVACLSWCPHVVNVALWSFNIVYDGALVNKLLSLHLTHLSLDVSLLHSAVTKYLLSKPVAFISVTHLEIIEIIDPTTNQIEQYFPSVTHLALSQGLGPSAQDILQCWKNKLEVLVWYVGRWMFGGDPGINSTIAGDVPNDPRVVVMPQRRDCVYDWNETTRDGPG
ncbi:hypothetical protein BDN72DRAFT_851206, partial [Pluteus cervinus]